MPLLPQAIANLVAQDHQPRQATADDGTEHMLWWNGQLVRSCALDDWPAAAAPELQAAQDAAAQRQALRTKLTSAVGVQIDDLLVGQMKALLAYLLWGEGALDRDLKIKPLSEWEAKR